MSGEENALKITQEDSNRLVLEGRCEKAITGFKYALVIACISILPMTAFSFFFFKNEALTMLVFISMMVTISFIHTLHFKLKDKHNHSEKLIIDKNSRLIRYYQLWDGKPYIEKTFKFEDALCMTTRVYSYDIFSSQLALRNTSQFSGGGVFDSSSYSITITSGGLESTNDHREKITLTNKVAKFIGVSLVDTSRS